MVPDYWSIAPDLPQVNADAVYGASNQYIMDNAIKFSPNGGEIRARLASMKQPSGSRWLTLA
jgi:hypothetical protein